MRDTVRRRTEQAEFVARGIRSIEAAKRSGRYVEPAAVVGKLRAHLDNARARVARSSKPGR